MGNERIVSAYFLMKRKTLPAEISGRFVQGAKALGRMDVMRHRHEPYVRKTPLPPTAATTGGCPICSAKRLWTLFKSCTYAYYRGKHLAVLHVTAFFTDEPTLCEAVLTGSIPRVKISWCDELEERFYGLLRL